MKTTDVEQMKTADVEQMKTANAKPRKPTMKKYFSYKGRLNRRPYFLRWLGAAISAVIFGILLWAIISFIAAPIISGIGSDVTIGDIINVILTSLLLIIFALLFILFCLVCIVFMLLQAIKRLHDLDKSGWYLLILFGILVPLIGKFIVLALVLYLLLANGTKGENRFGPDPLGRKANDDGIESDEIVNGGTVNDENQR
ncbi:MAG: DUF805 domain-containing protein [Methanimicrococcus sp.]|nr:DUF805 domain-containing protein [Methanimicrococcus sp.]